MLVENNVLFKKQSAMRNNLIIYLSQEWRINQQIQSVYILMFQPVLSLFAVAALMHHIQPDVSC